MKVGVLGNGGTSVFDRFSFSISVIVNTQIQKTCPDMVKRLMIVIVREFAINLFQVLALLLLPMVSCRPNHQLVTFDPSS